MLAFAVLRDVIFGVLRCSGVTSLVESSCQSDLADERICAVLARTRVLNHCEVFKRHVVFIRPGKGKPLLQLEEVTGRGFLVACGQPTSLYACRRL